MDTTKLTIVCPHCNNSVSLNAAITHQIQDTLQKKFDQQLQREKAELWKIAQEKALEKIKAQQDFEMKLIKNELNEKNKLLEMAQQSELDIRKIKNKLEEEKRSFELQKQREIDEARDKIRHEVSKILTEEHQLKDSEKDKRITDMLKTIEDLKRKAQQGSQQLQGEVLELHLEEILKAEFPLDQIKPIAKGVTGADILQYVHDRTGKICGIICWESKRAKSWSESWVAKLKQDQREVNAEVAVLISSVLPNGVKNFGPKDGIYVCDFSSFASLAKILRMSLIQIADIKKTDFRKAEKKEVLWNYLTSTAFKQRMESIFETFISMKLDLEKEKQFYIKIWAKREKQTELLMANTSGMRGELEELIGQDLPTLKGE